MGRSEREMSSFLLLTEGGREGAGVKNQALVYWGPLLEEICWSNMFESLAAKVSPANPRQSGGRERRGRNRWKLRPSGGYTTPAFVFKKSLVTSSSAQRVQLTEATTVVTHFYHSVSSGSEWIPPPGIPLRVPTKTTRVRGCGIDTVWRFSQTVVQDSSVKCLCFTI